VAAGAGLLSHPDDAAVADLILAIDRYEKAEKNSFIFSYVEGSLVKALREGCWILLEEINLANADVLERLQSILGGGSLTLTEFGSHTPVARNPNFRLFATMNPGTQIGKKELAFNLRVKFTELWIPDAMDYIDIQIIAKSYLPQIADTHID
jgi:midasin